MAQVFDLAGRVFRDGGETILGLDDLGTHACYLIYGVLSPGDPPRKLLPGPGHEEIFIVISGAMEIKDAERAFVVQSGQAFHLQGEESYEAQAAGPGEARYIAAGGHTPGAEHSHH
ncbi:MAG: hypothetical protein PVG03_16095 [Desulfarculaceae bacterium]